MTTVLITGAAGNLGSLLTKYLLVNEPELDLILMQYRTKIAPDIRDHPRIQVRDADLSDPKTLANCLEGADSIVHFAGVLFQANPEEFLHETNTQYFKNLIEAAKVKNIKKVILISFPHVEGPTSRDSPAVGRLDGFPISVHAKTRLEEEVQLFEEIEIPISLRVGMVYGKGILMIDAAEWFARKWLLGVWREPTEIHLISKTDFCKAVTAAVKNTNARGIYHAGDEGADTLQSFLDFACSVWECKKPWRMPLWLIYFAAELFELASKVFGTTSPLTRDFIDIGRVPYFGDTTRFRTELLPELTFKNFEKGIQELIM
ncbi:MAG: NAD(P)H-binding protein [Anaerolineales bacterium]|nr:NAD(P)H-binding protein [Anaerolineales bacterium]